ncbi:MAG: tripartite tricarboxylate transporter substrate binding protein [Rhizobiales bacterium]|nr:tripartite tricarboxylate transporter substrate binding protein [Hyphomicrobiales bacterium]
MMRTLAALGLTAALLAAPATAQTYPTRPVTIVLPYAAGGNTDAIARTLAHRLERRLGQPFVIEPRLGAATVIGATHVARSVPDGYTILIGTSTTMAINASVYKKLPYDPTKDLTPIALVAGVPFLLVVNPALPVKSLADLVAYAKSRPGQVSYASNGAGGAGHLLAELMGSELGIKLVHVPYKGLSPALNDVVGGHVQMTFGDFATALPRAGKLRALGVSTAQRVGPAPEIAPLAEVGLKGFDVSSWQMMIAPGKTPPDILNRLNAELRAIVAEPAVQKEFSGRGLIPLVSGTPAELQAYVKSEIVRWGDVVRRAGVAATQ